HAGDLNPALTRELDKLLAVDDSVLSDAEICRLHALHIAGRDVQAFELAQSQLREVLCESEKHAAHAERTVKRFSVNLDEAIQDAHREAQAGATELMAKLARVLAEASQLQAVLGLLHQQLTKIG